MTLCLILLPLCFHSSHTFPQTSFSITWKCPSVLPRPASVRDAFFRLAFLSLSPAHRAFLLFQLSQLGLSPRALALPHGLHVVDVVPQVCHNFAAIHVQTMWKGKLARRQAELRKLKKKKRSMRRRKADENEKGGAKRAGGSASGDDESSSYEDENGSP